MVVFVGTCGRIKDRGIALRRQGFWEIVVGKCICYNPTLRAQISLKIDGSSHAFTKSHLIFH